MPNHYSPDTTEEDALDDARQDARAYLMQDAKNRVNQIALHSHDTGTCGLERLLAVLLRDTSWADKQFAINGIVAELTADYVMANEDALARKLIREAAEVEA